LCEFRLKRFVRQLWRHLQMLSFLTSSQATYNVLLIYTYVVYTVCT
jgi:hypothetical protein